MALAQLSTEVSLLSIATFKPQTRVPHNTLLLDLERLKADIQRAFPGWENARDGFLLYPTPTIRMMMNASDYGVNPLFPARQDCNLGCWGRTFSGDSYLCSLCFSKVASGDPLGLTCSGVQTCDVCVSTSAARISREVRTLSVSPSEHNHQEEMYH